MTKRERMLIGWVHYKLKDETLCAEERDFVETIRDMVVENSKLKKEIKRLKRKQECGSPSLLSH